MESSTLSSALYPNRTSPEIVVKQRDHTIKQASRVVYGITYALPGEVGFCIPQISEDLTYLQRLLTLLQAEHEVISEQVNPTTGSVVISYQPGAMSDYEMRSHLVSLIQNASTQEDVQQNLFVEEQKSHPIEIDVSLHSIKQSHNAEQPAKVTYSIAHAIPGRVRFHIPQIASDPKYVQQLEALLKADPVVTSERVNRNAASIVITYKTEKLRDSQKGFAQVFETAVSHLVSLIESANDITAGLSSANTSNQF